MHAAKRIGLGVLSLFVLILTLMGAQEPVVSGAGAARGGASGAGAATAAALSASKEDPAAVERGGKVYGTYCGGCHGNNARGGPGAPDLVRSVLVLDDEKGILIAPVVRDGRPDQGMPKLSLTEAQIADVVAWLHVQTYAAGHRTTYEFQDVVTGDPRKGEAFFNSRGKCNTCHSAAGDLKGIAGRYEPFTLQSRWLQPRGGRGGGGRGARGGAPPSTRSAITVTVTPASGQPVTGTLERIDDFNVSLRDSSGDYHSFNREGGNPKVEIHDPLQAHTDLLHTYTDADIHNVTAYLVTLK
ncbi:MAG TPA: cytochrome c [Bryobacteraceae bacterium]|nr:cytochrome c [Bryobacteraceae bacterium]